MPNVAKAGGIMMASLFLSRVLGFFREMIISAKFGQNAFTDAYQASFNIPDIIFFLVAGGALSSAFIPVFTEHLATDREDDAWEIFSTMANLMLGILLVLITACWIFAPQLVAATVPGYVTEPGKAEYMPLVVQMARIILPAQLAFFMGGLMFGVLYSKQTFAVPGLGPNIYNIGIIAGALFISQMVSPDIIGLSWGGLIGAYLGNIIVPIFAMKAVGVKYSFKINLQHEGVRKVFKLMIPVIAGLSLPGVFMLIVKGFASAFEGEGVITALTYGNQIMQVPLGIFGQAMALAAFPALSQFFAQEKMDLYRAQISKTLRAVLFLAVPAAAVMVAIPEEVITAIFQRGEFLREDTLRTAAGLRMFGIGAFAWCLHPTLMRGYFSIQKTAPPVIMGTITTVIFVGFCFTILWGGQGYEMLALAGSISAFLMTGMLMIHLNKTVGDIDIKGILLTAARAIVAVILPAALLPLASPVLAQLPDLVRLVGLGVLLLLAAWIYFFMAKLIGMPETAYVSRALGRKKAEEEPESDPDQD